MPYTDNKRRTFEASENLSSARVVMLAGTLVALHDGAALSDPLGVTEYSAAEGDAVSIRLIGGEGTVLVETNELVAEGVDLYCKAAGLVGLLPVAAGTYRRFGKALEATPAGGGIIEVLPYAYTENVTVAG